MERLTPVVIVRMVALAFLRVLFVVGQDSLLVCDRVTENDAFYSYACRVFYLFCSCVVRVVVLCLRVRDIIFYYRDRFSLYQVEGFARSADRVGACLDSVG